MGICTGYGLAYGLANIISGFVQPQQQSTLFATPERNLLAINPMFTPEWTVIAFAIIVCIVFGLCPARNASKLNPVEALRYE